MEYKWYETKEYNKFCDFVFACEADALKAVAEFMKKCKYFEITDISCQEVRKYQGKGHPIRQLADYSPYSWIHD